jgi:hypothetical protein
LTVGGVDAWQRWANKSKQSLLFEKLHLTFPFQKIIMVQEQILHFEKISIQKDWYCDDIKF